MVACSNLDMGPDVKAVCKTGCIGCKACTKAENSPMKMEGNVPVIDYEKYDPATSLLPVLEKCRMESLIFVGKPTAEDLRAAEGEEEPRGPIRADFKTTVDDAEWWG